MTADLAAIRARLAALDIPRLAWNHGQHNAARADLIANAPADLAALCDEVESLRAAVQRVREVALAEDDEEWVRRVGKSCLVAASEILRALDGAE